jgi:hypothetical protein
VSPVAAGPGQAEPRTAAGPPTAPSTVALAVIRLVLRRSVGRPAILAAAAVIVANMMLREREWAHEWQWAWFNYHFVTIFLGPLAAGLGAWEGARLARARDFLGSAGAAGRALASASGAVFAWLLLPYLAGLLWISGMVIGADTPGTPGFIEVSTLGPALAFLGAWVVIGAAAGYRFRSPLTAPLAAIASFSVILSLYIVNYTLVRVGGATGSSLGLAPRPEIQIGQFALYVTAATWALAWATRPPQTELRDRGRLLSLSAGALAVALGLGLFFDRGPDFRDRPVPLRCFGQQPSICLAPGYDRHPERVRAAIGPFLAAARDIGAPVPMKMRMGDPSEEDLVGRISRELALGDTSHTWAAGDFLTSYIRWSCDVSATEDRHRAWWDVYAWLASLDGSRPISPGDSFVSEILRTGTTEEQAAYLRGAIERLRRCA